MQIRNDYILIDCSDVLLILNNLINLKLLSTARGSEYVSLFFCLFIFNREALIPLKLMIQSVRKAMGSMKQFAYLFCFSFFFF